MFDAFLKIGSIPGESRDDKHKDWIEILSFSWGVSQPSAVTQSRGGARSTERVNAQDFSIVHKLDKASTKLFLACCKGEHMKDVTVELCRATGDKQKYMEYKLTDVIVSSVQPNGSSKGGEALPLEAVTFNYGKCEMTYTVTDPKTGKPSGDVKAYWSLIENKGG